MNPEQALQIIENFRRVAVIPNGSGRDYDTVRQAVAILGEYVQAKIADSHAQPNERATGKSGA